MEFPNFQRIIIKRIQTRGNFQISKELLLKEFKHVFVDISKIFIASNESIKEKCRELITTFIFNELSHLKEFNKE